MRANTAHCPLANATRRHHHHVTSTSASVPLHHDKCHILMTSSDQKAPRSQFLLKSRDNVIFAHFHSFFSPKLLHANYVQVTARAYSPPPDQANSSVLLRNSLINLQITLVRLQIQVFTLSDLSNLYFQCSSVNYTYKSQILAEAVHNCHAKTSRTALLPVFPQKLGLPLKNTEN